MYNETTITTILYSHSGLYRYTLTSEVHQYNIIVLCATYTNTRLPNSSPCIGGRSWLKGYPHFNTGPLGQAGHNCFLQV